MHFEILDEILDYLHYIQNIEKPYVVGSSQRDQYFTKYDKSFFKSAINKLLKDQYIILGNNVKVEHITPLHIAGLCNITFEGVLFYKSGGYKKQFIEDLNKEKALENLQKEQRRQSKTLIVLNRWLVFGAIVVAIDSILNILKFFNITIESFIMTSSKLVE